MHEASNPNVARWKCHVSYDGSGFSGWQSQPGANAIQDVIEARLAAVFGSEIRIHGSGRTDAGVHARGQVFHFDAAWRHGPEKLLAAFRIGLPPSIQIWSAEQVEQSFHSRFSAKGKRYTYDLISGAWADPFTHAYTWSVPRPLDLAAMEQAACVLRGAHDFRAFSAFGGEERECTVRDLRRLEFQPDGKRLRLVFEADGFLYKMVRSLVGGLVYAGLGKLTAGDVVEILSSGVRTHRIETAPPQGLFLDKVFYS